MQARQLLGGARAHQIGETRTETALRYDYARSQVDQIAQLAKWNSREPLRHSTILDRLQTKNCCSHIIDLVQKSIVCSFFSIWCRNRFGLDVVSYSRFGADLRNTRVVELQSCHVPAQLLVLYRRVRVYFAFSVEC